MKKHLRILVCFDKQRKKDQYNKNTRRFDPVVVNVYRLEVDAAGLDCVDAFFLGQMVNRHIDTNDDVLDASGYDGVWARGLKEFMWRIGYEIEFVKVDSEAASQNHNELTQNPFKWLDFRAWYPSYEHRE